jgi:hypothetical protein
MTSASKVSDETKKKEKKKGEKLRSDHSISPSDCCNVLLCALATYLSDVLVKNVQLLLIILFFLREKKK